MQSSENDPLTLPFASKDAATVENKLFVAATVAAVVLAGSAIAYRHVATTNPGSTIRLFWRDSRGFEELEGEKIAESTVGSDAKIGLRTVSTSTATYATGQELEHNSTNTTGTSKSSRPKDRRKRGKDPLREALKSGKKLKSFPNPAGSSSIPSSPPSSSAILSPSLIGKEKRVGENVEQSFETTRAQSLDTSQVSSESQRIPTKGVQREHSPSTPAIRLSAGHSRDVLQLSRSTQDEEDDLAGDSADFPATSNYRQYAHTRIQSPNSPSQSSLSLPRSVSSLADVSEGEPEGGGWVTSVSKSRSKHRARLEDVMFEDVRTGSGGLAHDGLGNQAEDDGMAQTKEKTTDYMHQGSEVTESYSNSTVVFEGTSIFPPSNGAPISFLSTELPLRTSCSDTNSETGDTHQLRNSAPPWLPSTPIDPSSEKINSKVRVPMQDKQEDQQELPDPTQWDGASTSQSTALSYPETRNMRINEVLNANMKDHEQENRKQPRFQPKGSCFTSFSSAVTGGGEEGGRIVIGQCQTVSVAAAVASKVSVSRSSLTETDHVSEAGPWTATGAEDREMEFTFPTLNSQATKSSSSRSTRALIGTSAGPSSLSKKNKRFSSNKNDTPPPNAPPSRTSSPSNTRENHTHSGLNASGGSTVTPSLSAQTQLASLRGALEAARLREEKHKTEMEKLTKELEMVKWESTNSRRGEVELQAQVRQLTHQLQSYAALFASMAPHLNSHFALQPQANDDVNTESSPKIDPRGELPNGGVDPSASESPEHEKQEQVAEAQEEEAVSSSGKAQVQNHVPVSPTQQPLQLLSSPAARGNDIASPLVGAQQPSAALPTFFPYYMPTQHPNFYHSPWMYPPYQTQQSTQNMSGTANAPSSPPPPRHYANAYSPTMYPISPVTSPLSPQSIGIMSPQLLHQYQPFGFGGDLRSTGASSTGSPSPETAGPPSGFGTGLNKPRPRIRRRKSQLANLNGNARAGWEDIGDGWIGLSKVVMQPAAISVDKGRITDEGATADGEGEDDNVESTSSPYSELLADAILKRSSTIRPSKKNDKKENSPLVSQEGAEDVEPYTEFTFPTLSNVSNDYYRTASRTESSVSSSLSSSPPSTTATVPDLTGDPGWEEDKASLPPVIENAEDLDPLVSDVVQRRRRDVPLSKVQDTTVTQEATPKKEDHEQPPTDSLKQ